MANPIKVIINRFFPRELQTENNNIETQSFDPDLTHTVALVSGWDGQHEHLVNVDAAGNMYVNTAASSYLHYQVINITAPTSQPASPNVSFGQYVSEMDILISGNGIYLAMVDSTNGALGGTIPLSVGSVNLKYVTNSLSVWSQSSTAGATVTVIGWW
ncbi:MAG: hypothetical protein QW478_15410 [Candidatus Micrarchaeaceae archaeon]